MILKYKDLNDLYKRSFKKIFGGFMSIPKFKRKPSGLDYVDNAINVKIKTDKNVKVKS